MNYRVQKINFREVLTADTFHLALRIADAYPLTSQTRISMQVRSIGSEVAEPPVLDFSTDDGSIQIDGQVITLHKEPTDMRVRPGRFVHDMQFTKENITSTLYAGIFEILQDSTLLS